MKSTEAFFTSAQGDTPFFIDQMTILPREDYKQIRVHPRDAPATAVRERARKDNDLLQPVSHANEMPRIL
jgi:hypothetical protein